MPKGIIEQRPGKYQARLLCAKDENQKSIQRPIPGRFGSIEAAVEAQAAAQLRFDGGGVAAVWPTEAPAPHEKRGTVRAHPKRVTVVLIPCCVML